MPNLDAATTLKHLVELVLDLQARSEVAEDALKAAQPHNVQVLEQERKTRLQVLKALPKPAWFLSHLQLVKDHDVDELLTTLKSRR
jgi:hypothetical protein